MGSIIPPPIPPKGPGEPPRGPGVAGPPIPADGMPDAPPFRLDRLEELAAPNHAGEIIFLVTGRNESGVPIKLILACNPHTGQLTRAAWHFAPGIGYTAMSPGLVPGNLRDICATLALEAGAETQKNRD